MKKFLIVLIVLFNCCISLVNVQAADTIVLPDLISDNMLIQQGKPIALWGTGSAGATVTAKLMKGSTAVRTANAVVSSDGKWTITLEKVSASRDTYSLVFSSGSYSKTVSNVAIGELWVQCGQSNMALTVNSCSVYKDELLPQSTNNSIRLFMDTSTKSSSTRVDDLTGSWVVASSSNVLNYSAVGYTALKTIYDNINIPVGGICNAIGGAAMSAFTGPSTKGSTGGSYYNAKVAPVSRLGVRGIMWYQGEGNRNDSYDGFASAFKTLISTWRTDFGDASLPFAFVQLPASPMKYYASWLSKYIVEDFSTARLAQTKTLLETNNTAMAISIDCAPLYSSTKGEDPLHPWNKKPVGERLGRAALAQFYGKNVPYEYPMYKSLASEGGKAIVKFSGVGKGLKTTDSKPPRCFMVAGADGVYYPGTAEITSKDTVTVYSANVPTPKSVAYSNEKIMYPYTSVDDGTNVVIHTYPDVNLVNSDKLPACPFVTTIDKANGVISKNLEIKDLKRQVFSGENLTLPGTISVTQNNQTSAMAVNWIDATSNITKDTKAVGIIEQLNLIVNASINCAAIAPAIVEGDSIQLTKQGGGSVFAGGDDVTVSFSVRNSNTPGTVYLWVAFYTGNKLDRVTKIPVQLLANETKPVLETLKLPDVLPEYCKIIVTDTNVQPLNYEYQISLQ